MGIVFLLFYFISFISLCLLLAPLLFHPRFTICLLLLYNLLFFFFFLLGVG